MIKIEKKVSKHLLHYITKSKFVRSVFLQTVAIFLIVIVAVIVIVFFSFTSEINRNIMSERQKQLGVIGETVSKRMEEVSSIAYNVSTDKSFYLEAVDDNKYSGYEMSKTLEKYLVGNDFIEFLAYYRLSQPDMIYASCGEMTIHDFWNAYLNFENYTEEDYVSKVKAGTNVQFIPLGNCKNGNAYFTYVYALPQFSENPQAFVIMLIPLSEVEPILESQLTNCYGEIAVFNSQGEEMHRISNLKEDIDIKIIPDIKEGTVSSGGKKYIVQKDVSTVNSWTYISVIRLNDIISEVAAKQIIFIVVLLLLMVVAVFAMLRSIIKQYKPISNLAMTLTDNSQAGSSNAVIDEESLISDTFATLKDDSDQKQKFEEAYYEAEAANRAKSAFLSNMSHDIRTPMNAIIGMTEIAIKNSDNPEYVNDCLQKVRVSSQYLLDIINNVLDMSKIESGKITLSEDIVELPKLVYGLITILNQSLDVKSQKFIVDVENIVNEKIIGDNVRLSQILMNILSNSVKFTPNGGTISLHISQTGSLDGWGDYVFVCSDTGVGMSQEFTKQVFETFTRDEKAGISKIEGTGLGMAIAKSFVELMGGTIKCDSELGVGTTFTVTMHFRLAQEETTDVISDKSKASSVLSVCNEEQICINQVKLFSSLGVKAEYALSIPEAIEKSDKEQYDFIIISQTDSDKSGIDAVTKLSKGVKDEKPTYIFAARDLFSIDRSEAFNSGISSFVQIPLFTSTAVRILNRAFERHGAASKKSVVNLENVRILLAEDNKINREIARALIKDTKATIFEATNGKEAVDAFKNSEVGYFDIILMDLQMPEMNGYEATSAIRSIQRADALSIPIYAMTAKTFDEDVRQVKEAGMNGHLGKPYVPDELYKILINAAKK